VQRPHDPTTDSGSLSHSNTTDGRPVLPLHQNQASREYGNSFIKPIVDLYCLQFRSTVKQKSAIMEPRFGMTAGMLA